jgi:hypothetical protein
MNATYIANVRREILQETYDELLALDLTVIRILRDIQAMGREPPEFDPPIEERE